MRPSLKVDLLALGGLCLFAGVSFVAGQVKPGVPLGLALVGIWRYVRVAKEPPDWLEGAALLCGIAYIVTLIARFV